MKFENMTPEVACDLITLINSCKGLKKKEVVENGVSKKSGKEYSLKYKYVELETIYECVKKNDNFALLTPLETTADGRSTVRVFLVHKSGAVISSDPYVLRLPETGNKRDEGSIITYTRRYALGAFLGIGTDSDPDSNPHQDDAGNRPIRSAKKMFFDLCQELNVDKVEVAREYGLSKYSPPAEYEAAAERLKCETLGYEEISNQAPEQTPRSTVSEILGV